MAARVRVKPGPVILISLFVAVAVIDLVHHLRQPPQPLPDLLRGGGVVFEGWEPMIDFRASAESAMVQVLPRPQMAGDGWSGQDKGGRWIQGSRAELGLDLARGGQRVLIIECFPTQGQRPVRVLEILINGVHCGRHDLSKGWGTYTIDLPGGVTSPGPNRITFRLPDRDDARTARRALLLRRLALVVDGEAGPRAIRWAAPVEVDLERRRVTVRSSGRLSIPFAVDDRIDALRMRCRIVGGKGRCEVVVARPQGSGPGRDPVVRRILDSDQEGSSRVRVPLHGRRGDFLLTIEADLASGPGQLIVAAPELVKDRGSSSRPSAS
jgi:hypothetical protein